MVDIKAKVFKEWLITQNSSKGKPFSTNTAGTYANSLKQLSFFEFDDISYETVYDIDDLAEAERIYDRCLKSPKLNQLNKKRCNGDFKNGFKMYLKYLCSDDKEYIPQPVKKAVAKRGNKNIFIPTPCNEEVEKYLNSWEELEKYNNQEKAIDLIFRQSFPQNNNIIEVLAKASILNDFYSTNIFDVHSVAKHIIELDIDERLRNGDSKLVNEITQVKIKDKTHKFYSFATKYCSFHQQDKYAIYDSYVEKVLMYFKSTGFCKFKKEDLRDYEKFLYVVKSFRSYFNLENYSLKQIDRYLWLLGKDKFEK